MSNLGFATDVANRNFDGAQNPDSMLHVEFFMHEPIDQIKSREAGKNVYQTKYVPDGPPVFDRNGFPIQKMKDTGERLRLPFIRIVRPGDNTSVLEVQVRDEHKRRWPNEWLYFASQEGLIQEEVSIPGWKLEEWSHINSDPESVRNLKFLRFHTVEQVAGASDAQCQKLGMGGNGLREKARADLRDRIKENLSSELQAKDDKLNEQAAQIAGLTEQMAELKRLMIAQANKGK